MAEVALPGRVDVLIVGAGPAGASVAFWLARAGHRVAVVERKRFPRAKTCGGALTPLAVQHLHAMDLDPLAHSLHRTEGVVLRNGRRAVELPWPSGGDAVGYGFVAPRAVLDRIVIDHAVAAGATLLDGIDAIAPIVERGFVRGAIVQNGPPPSIDEGQATADTAEGALGIYGDLDGDADSADPSGSFSRPRVGDGTDGLHRIRADYVVVADGANSRFGRLLGTFRRREWPHGTAVRSVFASARHDDRWLESNIDLRSRSGSRLPGYGWVFPTGDGTVNVGIGLLSTAREFNGVNTTSLLHRFVESAADRWALDPARPLVAPQRGRIPLGGSVGPQAGLTYLVIGDAAGSASAFNGDGIEAALGTGRIAADVIDRALANHDPVALQRYPDLVAEAVGRHQRLGRRFARTIGHPIVMDAVANVATANRRVAGGAFAAMGRQLEPGTGGAAGATYRAASRLARLLPE